MKKNHKIFIQPISVVNFNMIGPLLTSLRCPKVLGQKGSHGSKNEKNNEKKN